MKSEIRQESTITSAGKVSGATFISRILGLVREQVTAYLFGAGNAVDAFKSAFRIPNLLRDLFAEGALSAGFVPIFSEKLKLSGREAAIRFASLVFGALLAIVALVVLLLMLLAPDLVNLIAGGFERLLEALAALEPRVNVTVDPFRVEIGGQWSFSVRCLVLECRRVARAACTHRRRARPRRRSP